MIAAFANSLRKLLGHDDRAIFRYWDGRRIRRIDPLSAWMALKGHKEFLLDEHPQFALAEDLDAMKICVAAAREVFNLAPLDDSGRRLKGVTDGEAFAALLAFRAYMGGLKKNTSGPPTSSPSITPDSPAADSLTSSASESG